MQTTTRISRRRRPLVESMEGRQLLTAGALDTSFGGTGQVVTTLGSWTEPDGLVVQPDLKTVVVGLERVSTYYYDLTLIRYNVDGSLDTSFGGSGEVSLATNSAPFLPHNSAVALQPDGKIVVATNTTTYNGSAYTSDMLALRFNSDGSLDTSFGQNGQSDIHLSQGMAAATGVAILSGGQIVMVGTNPTTSIGPEYLAARLTSTGALDMTFGPNGQGYNYETVGTAGNNTNRVWSLGVAASGDILVGGDWSTSTGARVGKLVRYTPNGLIDTSFANQGVLILPYANTPQSLSFQSNGQTLVGGGGVTRLNPNGTIDTSFGSNGTYYDAINRAGGSAMAVQPDDKILIQCISYASNGNTNGTQVERLLPGGWIDPTFGTNGRVDMICAAGNSKDIAVGPDGKITGTFVINTLNPSAVGVETFRLLGDPAITGQLAVTQQPPSSLTAGTPFGLSVQVDDSSGNVESSFSGPVSVGIASGPGGATLGGTLTVNAINGVATFSGLTLTKAASNYTLLAYGTGLGDAYTAAMTVSPSTASQVVFTQQPPTSVTAGTSFGLQAAIEDQYGNIETGAGNAVTLALANNPGGATLGGTLTATASNGVTVFSGLTLTKAATGYTFQVSSSGLTGSVSGSLAVTPAAASRLLFTQQPTSVVVNTTFTLVAEIVDAYGNVVTSANNSVTIALGNNPTGTKLGGTLTATAKNGVVTFSGLKLNKVGTGYTILISSKGLAGTTSGPINVTAS